MISRMLLNNCMKVASLMFLAATTGFWETKSPDSWTVREIQSILESSPWSRTLRVPGGTLEVHLSSALPMREAENRQRAFQKRAGAPDASFAEYLAMVEEGGYIVLGVNTNDREAFADGAMVSRMQKDTEMRAGKKAYPLLTHFPPSSTDPYLRLVFTRPRLAPSDKSLAFTFLVPGAIDPYRRVEL